MSESKTSTPLGKTKRFSDFRCTRCHSYLLPLTEEIMAQLGFTLAQKQKIKKYELTHFCLKCMRGYQREEKPLSKESENCAFCGNELLFLRHKGEVIDILWCIQCEEGFKADEGTLKKIEEYTKKQEAKTKEEVE